MKRKLEKTIGFVIFIILIYGGWLFYNNIDDSPNIKIANWNLGIFGEKKSQDSALMKIYSEKIKNYDIVFIQEIRDKEELAFPKLCAMLQNYSCKISSRAGRTVNKEQYGIIYKNGINFTYFRDYNPDEKDRWERPPIEVAFKIRDYEIIIYNIHIKPDDVQKELEYLKEVVSDSGNVIIIGDLNADCSYYNAKQEKEFDDWNWIVKDSDDTTSSSTNCAYDRIILNGDAKEKYKKYGIDKEKITDKVSDHYLIWVKMKTQT